MGFKVYFHSLGYNIFIFSISASMWASKQLCQLKISGCSFNIEYYKLSGILQDYSIRLNIIHDIILLKSTVQSLWLKWFSLQNKYNFDCFRFSLSVQFFASLLHLFVNLSSAFMIIWWFTASLFDKGCLIAVFINNNWLLHIILLTSERILT